MTENEIIAAAELIEVRRELEKLVAQTPKKGWQGEIGFVSGVSDGGCSGEGSVYLPLDLTRDIMRSIIQDIDRGLAAMQITKAPG